jgi:hypothetical protein
MALVLRNCPRKIEELRSEENIVDDTIKELNLKQPIAKLFKFWNDYSYKKQKTLPCTRWMSPLLSWMI